jgi:hypothetical protein
MNMSQETELYKCSCGYIHMGSPDTIAAISEWFLDAYCPSCSKEIKLCKCQSCDHVCMVEARRMNEVAPGVVNVICPKCNNTNQVKKR